MDTIRCVGGPCDGKKVSILMGDSWPAATRIIGNEALIGYYELVVSPTHSYYQWMGGADILTFKNVKGNS